MYVARDKDGVLHVFNNQPTRQYPYKGSDKCGWWFESTTYTQMPISTDLFPELRWEDEPIEVELVRKEEKK